MGTFADSLFNALMSWVRALVSGLWALFTSDHTTVLEFLGRNWMLIAVVIVAAGLVIDWIIWLLRWQPYHLWAQRARRLFGIEEPEAQEDEPLRATAAVMPVRPAERMPIETEAAAYAQAYAPELDDTQAQAVLEHARQTPDEYAYPGMHFSSTATGDLGGTQRYGAVTQEGPGAAEVARRRAEIEAWQLQMQEEARARAEAERMEREAREAERARAAREAYEAEQARLAQEAYEAEQARLAQQEYERQLAEYERQKAQYEIELAEYERQKAEYEAQLASQQAAVEQAESEQPAGARRRRSARKTYSDYVEGEAVSELPDAPQWPQPERGNPAPADSAQQGTHSRLLSRMAKMMETEEEQLAARTKLPPRVNMQDAYRPAAAPKKPGRRSRNA